MKTATAKSKNLPIRHIGAISALCNCNLKADFHEGHTIDRYEGFGITERFKDEAPYRICKRCINILKKR